MVKGILLALAFAGLAAPALASWDEAVEALKRKDYETALQKLQPLAQHGELRAIYTIGQFHQHGLGVAKNYAEAAKWFSKAAEQGYAPAQAELAMVYLGGGHGLRYDFGVANKWIHRSANQGYAEAQSQLGQMYAKGMAMPQDLAKAYLWLSLAAAQGHTIATQERDKLGGRLTPEQTAEARRLAAEFKPKPERP